MLSAGTVEAYLSLSTDDFKLGIFEALSLLSRLRVAGDGGSACFAGLTESVAGAAMIMTGRFAGGAKLLVRGAGDLLTALGETGSAADFLGSVFGRTGDTVAGAVGGMCGSVQTGASRVGELVSGLVPVISDAGGEVSVTVGKTAEASSGTAVTAAGLISTAASNAAGAVANAVSSASGAASSGARSIAGSMDEAAAGAERGSSRIGGSLSATSGAVGSASGKIAAALSGMASNASARFTETASAVGKMSSAQPRAAAVTDGIADAVKNALSGLPASAQSIMTQAGAGMVAGLSAKTSAIVGVASGIAARVSATIRSALQIASPSKVMRRLGQYTGEGFALGIADTGGAVAGNAAALAGTVVGTLGAAEGAAAVLPQLVPPQGVRTALPSVSGGGESPELTALTRRLDALIDRLDTTGQVMQVDGRSFGRLVREYV